MKRRSPKQPSWRVIGRPKPVCFVCGKDAPTCREWTTNSGWPRTDQDGGDLILRSVTLALWTCEACLRRRRSRVYAVETKRPEWTRIVYTKAEIAEARARREALALRRAWRRSGSEDA